MAHMDCMSVQILNGGAPCQQIDSEEDDDQEAEAEDEVRRCIANLKLLAPVTLSRAMLQALLPPCATPAISMLLPPCCNPCCHPGVVGL